MRPVVLTIAGADPTGGAGIQADLRTFEALGCRGTSAITALTLQDDEGVHGWEAVSARVVRAQVAAVLRGFRPAAAKTGMLGTAAIVGAVTEELRERGPRFLVVDPVLVSSSGADLLEPAGLEALRERLLPIATLVTPNRAEAERLSGMPIASEDDAVRAGEAIRRLGAQAVVVTGGHLPGSPTDVLVTVDGPTRFPGARIDGPDVHGTGCVFSAAVTARLAAGADLSGAVAEAKRHTLRTLRGELAG